MMRKITALMCAIHAIVGCTAYAWNFVEHQQEHFFDDPVRTECTVWEQFKERPLDEHITYFAAPLSWILNWGKLSDFPPVRSATGGFTVCQHDYYWNVLPAAQRMGLDVVFASSCIGETFGKVKVLPFPQMAVNAVAPAEHKDILYSFIGFRTHETRAKIFTTTRHAPNAVVKERGNWHFFINSDASRDAEKQEYQDVLARSRFSLCPRGNGRSTLRFWESLCAGAIPIVMPAKDIALPGTFDWDSCIIAIDEDDIDRIPEILAAISPEQEAAMRKQCLKAYSEFSGENFSLCIRKYYEEGPWEAWKPAKYRTH